MKLANQTILKWERVVRNDLFVEFECTCPNDAWIGTAIEYLMKHKIKLWGYADANFFDNANKEPREINCKCGKKYTQQWFINGDVIIEEIN